MTYIKFCWRVLFKKLLFYSTFRSTIHLKSVFSFLKKHYTLFLYFFINLFILLFLAALGLRCYVWAFSSCGKWASHCGGFSCCGAWAPGARASVVAASGLSCPSACGIFPDEGSNPCPLHWQTDS